MSSGATRLRRLGVGPLAPRSGDAVLRYLRNLIRASRDKRSYTQPAGNETNRGGLDAVLPSRSHSGQKAPTHE